MIVAELVIVVAFVQSVKMMTIARLLLRPLQDASVKAVIGIPSLEVLEV